MEPDRTSECSGFSKPLKRSLDTSEERIFRLLVSYHVSENSGRDECVTLGPQDDQETRCSESA